MSNRQDGPHAHCNVFHPSYRWLFVPDLGDNCIHQVGSGEGWRPPCLGVDPDGCSWVGVS
jgi:hypothetical protein